MRKILDTLKRYVFAVLKRCETLVKSNFLYAIWFAFFLLIAWGSFGIFGISLFLISIIIALYLGEPIIRMLEGARSLYTKREKEDLLPIFEDVYQDIIEKIPAFKNMPEIELCIIDNLTVNAFAIGRKTIAVTKGACDSLSEEELKGIIAHEFAHIYYGHSQARIMNTIGNGLISVFVFVLKLAIRVIDIVQKIVIENETKIMTYLLNLIRFILDLAVFLYLFIGNVILACNSRRNEYQADKFAFEVGYGEQLTEGLYLLQGMSLGEDTKIVSRMLASHPHIAKRIGRVETLFDNEG